LRNARLFDIKLLLIFLPNVLCIALVHCNYVSAPNICYPLKQELTFFFRRILWAFVLGGKHRVLVPAMQRDVGCVEGAAEALFEA